MRAFSETVDGSEYVEIILSNVELARLERGILVCGIVEINETVHNIAVRRNPFPFSDQEKTHWD